MTTEELRARLGDPATAIVDTRPLHAFNGWRVDGAPRGGHIPGAIAFPSEWLGSLDDEDVREILATKGLIPEQELVLYGDGAQALLDRLAVLGFSDVELYEEGWKARAGGGPRPGGAPPEVPAARPGRLAAGRARGGRPRGAARRAPSPLPRQLRRS